MGRPSLPNTAEVTVTQRSVPFPNVTPKDTTRRPVLNPLIALNLV
jgi:hypothetical protein